MTFAFHLATATLVSLSAAPADTVPLYDDLGDHHYEISTSEPLAQQYFDQGLRLTWAFNHAEAIRAFGQAAAIDPDCAMCYWGIAFAYGPNINMPMDSTSGVAAWQAIQQAIARKPHASEHEAALIDALAQRYAELPPAERAVLDSAWARAIGAVAERHPDDLEAATLAADARMNLSPWDYWTTDGEPKPGHERTLTLLEHVIAENPDHPGGCHLYIHAVEAAQPEKAVACAERLAGLMPGAGHLVHMPGHIYIRVGRYADAITANEHAVHADEAYIADQRPMGIYAAGYYPHNYHFMAFAALMAGRGEKAIDAARKLAAKIDPEFVRDVYFLEGAPAYPHLVLVTFGRWEDVLGEPVPAGPTVALGMAEYARGVALAALGQYDEADAALARVRELAAERAAGPETPALNILPIADHALAGEIALRRGDAESAVLHFQAAVEIEDSLQYDEPPLWYYPVRQSLGKALLEAGRPADAERSYREDLERFPENGWSLYGLAASLDAQGRMQEADAVRERLRVAWEGADLTLTASRM